MTKEENIRTQVLEMAESRYRWDLAQLWNDYCQEVGYMDDIIYVNDIDDMDCYFKSIADFYRAMGEYNEHDDFYAYNGYGIFNSFDKLTSEYSPIDFDLLIEWLMDDAFRCKQYNIEIDEEEDEDE